MYGKKIHFRIISNKNISEESSDIREWFLRTFVELIWDPENNFLFVPDNVFGKLYIFDTKTVTWSQISQKLYTELRYAPRKKQFLFLYRRAVEIWAVAVPHRAHGVDKPPNHRER